MKTRIILTILLLSFLVGAVVVAAQNQGNKEIKIDGGKRGAITFPHHLHQDVLGNCNACHSIFPKSPGAIKELIVKKELKKKQVMNKTCIKCHKEKKKAGENAGPTRCSECHVKE